MPAPEKYFALLRIPVMDPHWGQNKKEKTDLIVIDYE